jgi:hypothetical protein
MRAAAAATTGDGASGALRGLGFAHGNRAELSHHLRGWMPIGFMQLAEISWLEPSGILRSETDRIGSFFLALSIVFNDLKDMCELMMATQEELTTAEGVVGLGRRGKHTMIHWFVTGVLYELMVLIKKEKSVLAESEFTEILAEMHEASRASWAALAETLWSALADALS